jgi:hypothetical protein
MRTLGLRWMIRRTGRFAMGPLLGLDFRMGGFDEEE